MKKTVASLALGALLIMGGCGKAAPQEAPADPTPAPEEPAMQEPAGETTAYMLDTEASVMTWEGSKVTGSAHDGVVNIASGELAVADGMPVSGSFVIDMTTIKNTDGSGDGLDNHLKNEDFFDVANYPTAMFELTKFADGNATGNLTIKGVTHEISFPAEISMDGDKMMAKASFSIDRTKWNVKYGSGKFFKELGDKVIKDEMDFTLDLVANKK